MPISTPRPLEANTAFGIFQVSGLAEFSMILQISRRLVAGTAKLLGPVRNQSQKAKIRNDTTQALDPLHFGNAGWISTTSAFGLLQADALGA